MSSLYSDNWHEGFDCVAVTLLPAEVERVDTRQSWQRHSWLCAGLAANLPHYPDEYNFEFS
jgi:hypothetical protein